MITPWNTMDRNVTMGMTLLAGDVHLEDITVAGCEDFTASQTEPGCRLLYILHFSPALTHIEIWHTDDQGARVVDRTLPRLALLVGATYEG